MLLQACQLCVEIMVWSSVTSSEPWAIALASFGNLLVMLSDSTPGQWDHNLWEWSLVFCTLPRQLLSTSKFEVQWLEYCLSFRHKDMMALRLPPKHQKQKQKKKKRKKERDKKMLAISWRSQIQTWRKKCIVWDGLSTENENYTIVFEFTPPQYIKHTYFN